MTVDISFGGWTLDLNTQRWINRTYQRSISSICYDLTLGLWTLGYCLKLSVWCFDFEHFVNLCIWTCICFEKWTQYLVESCKHFICISLFNLCCFSLKNLIVFDFVCYWFVMFWVMFFFHKNCSFGQTCYMWPQECIDLFQFMCSCVWQCS